MGIRIEDIYSGENTEIGILAYLETNVSIKLEIGKITSSGITDVRINSYFQQSPDFAKLKQRIEEQRVEVNNLPADTPDNIRKTETQKLNDLERATLNFQSSTLQLADVLLKIRQRTPRMEQVVRLFEVGQITEADAMLDEDELSADQETLILQMQYIQQRRIDLSIFAGKDLNRHE